MVGPVASGFVARVVRMDSFSAGGTGKSTFVLNNPRGVLLRKGLRKKLEEWQRLLEH